MAKFDSVVFNEVSGKMGSMVLGKNGTVRRRVTQKNPNSAGQQAVRRGFAEASSAWSALSNPQKAGWSYLAKQIPLTDSVGRAYFQTGRKLYIACFLNARPVFLDEPLDAPTAPPTVEHPANFNVEVVAPGPAHPQGQIILGGVWPLTGGGLVLRATGPVSVDRNVFGPNAWRVLAALPLGSSQPSPSELAAAYAERYGVVRADARIVFSAFLVDASGFTGPVGTSDVTVESSAQVSLKKAA